MRFTLLSTVLTFIAVVRASRYECEDISKYSTEWFLSNTKPEWKAMSITNALFYTQGLSARARSFAKQEANKVTIWEVWPCENYQIIGTRSNPLKCIMSNPDTQLIYFENMSRAFAMMSTDLAAVMHRNINDPPMWSIWGRIELPVLKAATNAGGVVNWVTAIDAEDANLHKLEWTRMYGKVREKVESAYQQIIRTNSWKNAKRDTEVFERDESQSCGFVGPQHPLY
ncbi:hypothetical protein HYALB_00009062 [Hymenoscyphus albidus]|uniref:Uncharacterized protein n=1 Tax=Hymenoscyphus albidus TaxID=595503 RepID=A0A9N9LTP4_9HELO|nr:hypothetical protein HYALB_00009062 [Hymenoscyphus albidus]